MNSKGFYFKTFLLALVISPLFISIGAAASLLIKSNWGKMLCLSIAYICAFVLWVFYYTRSTAPSNSPFITLVAIAVSFMYYLVVWMVFFYINGYRYNFNLCFDMFLLPFLGVKVLLFWNQLYQWLLFAIIVHYMVIVAAFIIVMAVQKRRIKIALRQSVASLLIFVIVLSLAGYQFYDRSYKIISPGDNTEKVQSSFPLTHYMSNEFLNPFAGTPDLSVENDYPRLGAGEAAYPLCANTIRTLYAEIEEQYLFPVSAHDESIQRDRFDILFLLSSADGFSGKFAGFQKIPVAKQALVFIASSKNSIDNLSIDDIQKIYTGEIGNWKQLGGDNERIRIFGQPVSSETQTAMANLILSQKDPIRPIYQEYANANYGVAEYHNYDASIGYVFRNYVTGKSTSPHIKMLSIDGIYPSAENIESGNYPYVIDIIALVKDDENPMAQSIIRWLLSDQGKTYIGSCGYF